MSVLPVPERYARLVVWCLRLLLDGWPAHIPFTNLSDIDGGLASLRLLRDLRVYTTASSDSLPAPPTFVSALSMTLRAFCRTSWPPPSSLRCRSLSRSSKNSESRFHDLIAPRGQVAPLTHRQPVSTRARLPAPIPTMAEELVLHLDTLETVLTVPLGPHSSHGPHERRQRCDVNKARHRPVSNPEGRPMRARKVGALTSCFVLDRPARTSPGQGKVLKPLSELRLPVMVNDHLGGCTALCEDDREVDEIESVDESERRDRPKCRRCV
ncbi:hypothetical protein GSI_11199 [Ganoderma sinense ZZ0214-1]|uniref:Uncharacterized protein n=1 Tax=Ganoderma sinense ZZ0214-1 TaxID=1077348 RepID=A0A2G8RYY3_9APHY|nr:hypothetical protein GSI_11199 [Ganoderma sinense ZZ0214-1]